MSLIKQLTLMAIFLMIGLVPVFATTFKIATISPEGSMWMEKMRQGANEVATQTQDRVKFKFYPGGVMGNDKAVLRKIRIGQLQGGAVVGGSLSSYFPANQIYSQPMKFTSLEEVDYVRQHMDTFIIDGLNKAGFVVFGIAGGGFAYIMSTEPIRTVQDLQKRKVWIPDNDKLSQDAVEAFGVAPIPLPIADVRTSLQSGLIDTVATSPVGAIVLQWHTQIKYVTNIPFIYLHAVLAIDKKKFLTITSQDQEIVTRVMTHAFNEIGLQNRQDDGKAIAALKNQGIEFVTPDGKVIEQWRQTAGNASKKMVESGTLPKEAADQLDGLLNEFRAKGSTGAHAQ
ncbi:MAG: TRAP transporter substrate-binding protein DctP [Proteobacteria bacterium]|nr:TRAP transporter substrate-binding protein DctP [Pseudomonadota bacterium]